MTGFYMKCNTGLKWVKWSHHINLLFFTFDFDYVLTTSLSKNTKWLIWHSVIYQISCNSTIINNYFFLFQTFIVVANKLGKQVVFRFCKEKSLFLFGPQSFVRRLNIRIFTHQYLFKYLFFICIYWEMFFIKVLLSKMSWYTSSLFLSSAWVWFKIWYTLYSPK